MNTSNLNFFKEGSYIQRLLPFLDISFDSTWNSQKVSNLLLMFNVIRSLISPSNPFQVTKSCQKVMNQSGVLQKLCTILLSNGIPAEILTEVRIDLSCGPCSLTIFVHRQSTVWPRWFAVTRRIRITSVVWMLQSSHRGPWLSFSLCRWWMRNNRLNFAVLYSTVFNPFYTKMNLVRLKLSKPYYPPPLKVSSWNLEVNLNLPSRSTRHLCWTVAVRRVLQPWSSIELVCGRSNVTHTGGQCHPEGTIASCSAGYWPEQSAHLLAGLLLESASTRWPISASSFNFDVSSHLASQLFSYRVQFSLHPYQYSFAHFTSWLSGGRQRRANHSGNVCLPSRHLHLLQR